MPKQPKNFEKLCPVCGARCDWVDDEARWFCSKEDDHIVPQPWGNTSKKLPVNHSLWTYSTSYKPFASIHGIDLHFLTHEDTGKYKGMVSLGIVRNGHMYDLVIWPSGRKAYLQKREKQYVERSAATRHPGSSGK